MKKILTYHGAIILLNILCLVQIYMLMLAAKAHAAGQVSLPGNPTDTIPTFIFILIIDCIYIYSLYRNGLAERKTKDV